MEIGAPDKQGGTGATGRPSQWVFTVDVGCRAQNSSDNNNYCFAVAMGVNRQCWL